MGGLTPDMTAVEGVEDCLVVNVNTPRTKASTSDSLLPVMAFIHGGGFFVGSAETDLYGADRLIDYDVVSRKSPSR
jgi:carboxylesterase type B